MLEKTRAVVFRLLDKTLAVDIACIKRITALMDITVINEPERFIRGVVNLQGQVIVVADLAGLLGLSSAREIPAGGRIIFIELKKRVFGFIVDQVFDVAQVNNDPLDLLDMEKVFLKLEQG